MGHRIIRASVTESKRLRYREAVGWELDIIGAY